ncbi:hypothetical protein C7N43_30550 [Sphingobacteriales bacterium UPWRP_1]|nr:hypothetical protein BVG80_15965 [Sphingobacteriales bacterium TSM_CSM]PSJ73175.1 hypothetical protein C7N43_30550 [Sphingobacteriales bacterium UPWRP_1]
MMELDDLKNTWQQFSKAQLEQHHLDAEQIKRSLENRTFSAIGKIRRALSIDMALLAFFTLLALLYALLYNRQLLRLLLLAFGLIWAFTLIVNIGIHLLLNRVVNARADLRSSLSVLVNRLGTGIKTVYVLSVVMPVTGVFFGFIWTAPHNLSLQLTLLLLAIGLGIGIVFYPVMRWYIKKMLGNHYAELRQCLHELNEEETSG